MKGKLEDSKSRERELQEKLENAERSERRTASEGEMVEVENQWEEDDQGCPVQEGEEEALELQALEEITRTKKA
jgi:hypothetical protein